MFSELFCLMIAEIFVEGLKAKYVCVRACMFERERGGDRQTGTTNSSHNTDHKNTDNSHNVLSANVHLFILPVERMYKNEYAKYFNPKMLHNGGWRLYCLKLI